MKNKNRNPEDFARLRQKAEEQMMLKNTEIKNNGVETDMLKLIHELEVQLVELKMQNEELILAKSKARAATEKYEELYDFAPSGYFTLSRHGSILEINLLGAQMLGKERSLLINSHLGLFVKEDARNVLGKFLEEIFRGKSRVNCDLPLISSGNICLHFHLTGILSDNKEQCRITAIDITERKEAEDDIRKNLAEYKVLIDTFPVANTISDPEGNITETKEKAMELRGISCEEQLKRKLKGEERQMENALYENEERLRLALMVTNDVVWDWDIVKDSQLWSEAAKKVFGWTEIVSNPVNAAWWMERIHPDDRSKVVEGFNATVQNIANMHWQDEYRFRRSNGTYAEVVDRANILRDNAGKPIRMIGAMLDITERRNAEKLIKENEHKFRTVADFTYDMEYWQLPDGRLNYISPSCERITGYLKPEFISNPDLLVKIIHPDDLAKFIMHYNLENSGSSDFYEKEINFRIIKKDSAIIWIEHVNRAVFDDNNNYLGRRGRFRDITERKNAELALTESEHFANTISKTTPALLYLYDFEKEKNIWANDAHKRFFEDLLKDSSNFDYTDISQLTHPDDFRELLKLSGEMLNNSSINHYEIEHRLRCKDSWKWMKLFVTVFKRNSTGKPIQILGALFDINEQKKIEQDLRQAKEKAEESEERFNLAMKASNDGIFDWNLETNDIYYSPGLKKMLGFEDHELPNDFSVWDKTTQPEDAKNSWELQQKLLTKQIDRYEIELKMKHKDGHWVDILSRAEAFFNDSGKAIRIVGTHTDITERKLYTQEIHKLNEELEQRVIDRTAQLEAANKELEAFSYSVSHDLRTPLRAINGFATFLTEDYSFVLDDEGKRLLTIISENATKMGHLIDNLLSFSRFGRVEILPSSINMKTMAAAIYDELVPETEKDKIRFTLANIPAALGDPYMVKQVWMNLIGNAIKFTSKKTDIHIEIGVIAGEKENTYFVKDNGAGFDMAHATKLFGVFQRLHTVKEFDGTGAGLAIVRRIILRHNGRVWAEGKVNEGATFYFTMPLN